MSFAVVVDTSKVERVATNLLRINAVSLNSIALEAVNEVAKRGYEESRSRMLARVNLTDEYVKARMDVEAANDLSKPEATIIAFRQGGRRKGLRAVNLRQYSPVIQTQINNWSNAGVATNSGRQIFKPQAYPAYGPVYRNPRKPGGLLPFKPRIGDVENKIRVGQKSAGVSVEVVRGSRKTVAYAFMRRMPSGEILVMAREKGDHKGKGKIKSLSSLTVWQLFRKTAAEVIPFVREDLERTVGRGLDTELDKLL